NGTEGPFHPHRAFATRPVRADVESPHRLRHDSASGGQDCVTRERTYLSRAFRRDAYGGGGGGSGGSSGGGGGSDRRRPLRTATARRTNAMMIPIAAIEE